MKFTAVTSFKCTGALNTIHLHCCATITTLCLQNFIIIPNSVTIKQ